MQANPKGTRFAFEMGAAKTSGSSGWADVAKLGYFGWEYKGKDSDVDKAYEQLLRYRDALQNPPLLIVSDINKIVIRTNYTNLATRTRNSTRLSSPPTAGRPIFQTRRSSHGCCP